ncbi:chorion transcription factor Cf2-like [Melanotaenia boesemani]|uniref:chorion transcription factor Cf2-like n=1 Tax=Melanotaenia boesemani TaxID=1250792 RepID=UPI001C044CC5|nr:chorion transcription factor Cf2-like [Melanotaenia boesemani]
MCEIEELKTFVSERLHTAISEILVAITKTVKSYKNDVSRLKEENERHRSLLDIILKTKSPPTKAKTDTTSTAAFSAATNPHASDSRVKQKFEVTTVTSSSGLPSVFTTRDEFLKLASNGNCPFCLKRVQGTETHLVKRHYLSAVHFILDGNERFVIPCMCKEKIQDRSHWHCPLCKKIIYRRCNFDTHLSKQHKIALVQQSQEKKQPPISVLKAEIPLLPERLVQEEISSLERQENQTSLLLPAKIVAQQETQLQVQYDQQGLIQNSNGQMREQSLRLNQNQDYGLNIICLDTCIQDISDICIRNPLPNFSTQAVGNKPDTGASEMLDPAKGNHHTAGSSTSEETGSCSKSEESDTTKMTSSLNRLDPKKKEAVKRSLPSKYLYAKKARQSPAGQNTSGSFRCKACGKNFYYMCTLRTHVRTHAHDKTCICGICGKRLGCRESLVQHVQSHNKRNICGDMW